MSRKDKDPWVRSFTVTEPVRHKKGYTLYKVISKVFPKNSIEAVTQVTVWKRYNDFKKLHKALSSLHQNLYLHGTFPLFSKARFFGRFDEQVIEERRKCALALLEFAGKHSALFTSEVFVKFFESGQIVEFPVEPVEECLQPVLQPIVANLTKALSDESDLSAQPEDSGNVLGGIWQYHQNDDEISMSSPNATEGEDEGEEDDRTTFTDEDACGSKPVFDLSEFDPVLNNITSAKSQDICNDWLISAFQSCGANKERPLDSDCVMSFPKPFEDYDITVIAQSKDLKHADLEESVSSLVTNETDSPDSISDATNKQNIENFAKETNPLYIVSAGKCINAAQDAELNMKYSEAFTFYKTAVDVLLHGVQNEKGEQNEAVKRKILVYLKKAEEIYESFLLPSDTKEITVSLVNSPEKKIEKCSDLSLRKPMTDLAKYRVIGILSRVLLVLNTITNTTCVVKVLRKCPYPQQQESPNIAPQGINFMVQLHELYETTDAIFLILEYASGGRLWDYISSYLQRSPLFVADCDYQFPNMQQCDNLTNVYSGKKLHPCIETFTSAQEKEALKSKLEETTSSIELEFTDTNNYPPSYLALFKNYLISAEKNTVSLAKCHVRLPTLKTSVSESKTSDFSNNKMKSGDSMQRAVENIVNTLSRDNVCNSLSSIGDTLKCDTEISSEITNLSVKDASETSERNSVERSLCELSDAGKPNQFRFSELFSQMDNAVSLAASKPAHLPESCIVQWVAEIITALNELHKLGIVWQDFMPDNILLGSEGRILISYQSQWNSVHHVLNENAKKNLYSAPEVDNIFAITESCDWWSVGAILFELLTGKKLLSCHPVGITSHTSLFVPEEISGEAADLLKKLLAYNPSDRLGAQGVEEIKTHPFFSSIDWESIKYQVL